MTDENPSPFRLNPARIVILLLGALLLAYIASALLGGVSNYQQLREAARPPEVAAPAAPTQ